MKSGFNAITERVDKVKVTKTLKITIQGINNAAPIYSYLTSYIDKIKSITSFCTGIKETMKKDWLIDEVSK